MKNIFASVLLALFSCSLFAGVSVISDLDDTIKITNAGDGAQASYNGVFTTNVYSGMPTFLREVRTYSNKLHVVTGSPTVLFGRVRSLLQKHKIKVDSLSLRNPLKEHTQEFKTRVIKKILDNSSDDFILVGDDVDKDHVIYDHIKKLYPNRILAIYIHAIKNRPLPSSAVRYWTSFDLTMHEVLSNRMNDSQVSVAANVLLNESRNKFIIPTFANCPQTTASWEWQIQTIFAAQANAVATKLVEYCQARVSTLAAK